MLLALVLLFIVLPFVEIYVIVQVAHAIHLLPTIGLLLLDSVVGAWLFKREGAKAWSRFREALAAGRVPTRETADGALVILGGAFLVTPGFVTDVVGLLCVLPPTRALVRRALTRVAARRFLGSWTVVSDAPQRVRAERMPDRRAANEDRPRAPGG